MDAQALLTPDAVEQAMGRPLAHVPDPAGDGHDSYARHFAGLFLDTFERLGVQPDRVYWMSEVYAAGEMDRYIRVALDRAGVVREIYRRVANVRHPDEWHPLSVICENCGRVGTTIVTAWDGERVHYECRPDLVAWATGCGHAGDVVAVRRPRQAAVQRRLGGEVEPVRRDDRAERQGPRHQGRRPRPIGGRSPARCSSASRR